MDRLGVSALVDEVKEAWNVHDMHRFSGLFAADADFVNVVGIWWRSRDEIEQAHTASHAGPFRHSTLAATLSAYKELAPSLAVAHVTWELGGLVPNVQRRTTETRRGIWTWVVRDNAGELEIVAAQNTDRPSE